MRRIRLAPPAERRRPAGAAAGATTRIATFLLLVVGGLVALLFALRLAAAAFGWDFSPFPYLTPGGGHALLVWLLLAGMVVLALLVWLVLRHDADALWLASAAGDGGVLVPNGALERPAAASAGRCHPDVVRAEVELSKRGGLRARVRVWARPLADAGGVGSAADEAVRRQIARLTGRDLAKVDVRVKVLAVTQLARHLP